MDDELEGLMAYWENGNAAEYESDISISMRKDCIAIVMRKGNRLSGRYECKRKDKMWVLSNDSGALISTYYGIWEEVPNTHLLTGILSEVFKEEDILKRRVREG